MGGLFTGKKVSEKRNDNDFYAGISDAKIFDAHMRRFVNQGTIDVGHFLIQRMPFIDNDLMNFVYSLPDNYRKNYRLFHEMLRNYSEKIFLTVPWESTGQNIKSRLVNSLLMNVKWPAIRRRLSLNNPSFNYSKWVKSDNYILLLQKYLHPGCILESILEDDYKLLGLSDTNQTNFQKVGRALSVANMDEFDFQ